MSDYTNKSLKELHALCKSKGIKGHSGKNRDQVIALLEAPPSVVTKVVRLNYIGSKYQLLDWITETIKEKTGYSSFEQKRVADLFAGTGIVSYHFRTLGSIVQSNDAELYSSIITDAFTCSSYTDRCKTLIEQLNTECITATTVGYITKHYSPYETSERKFFTVKNAQKIDFLRSRIEELRPTLNESETTFLLASLLVSADAVSNVPAVYGCFLMNFKDKALKSLVLTPVHTLLISASPGSQSFHSDVLSSTLLESIKADIVYLDPPYNKRQYSKNYFPLNLIAKTPEALESEPPLKGKTGIPQDCFLSDFCKSGDSVEKAFTKLFQTLKTKWIFVSYNSESLITKEKMIELMQKVGTVTVQERDYKRFKSYEYNEDKAIKEYLFCLEKR